MSALEKTISMLELMNEEDLLNIKAYAEFLLFRHDVNHSLQLLNKEQILLDLKESRQQVEKGNYQDGFSVYNELMKKYEL